MPILDADKLMAVAVSRRWDGYYQHRWHAYKRARKLPFTWNWAAFLFGIWWLLYRRMYSLVLLDWMVFYFLASKSVAYFNAILIIGRIVLGAFGTQLYFWHVSRSIDRLIRMAVPIDVAIELIRSKYQTLADRNIW